MMARLTNAEKDRLRARLIDALCPSQAAALAKLREAAYAAAVTEFFGAKNLKLFAAMPAAWFGGRRTVQVHPSSGGVRYLESARHWHLPCNAFFSAAKPSPATQAAIDAFDAASNAAVKTRNEAADQVNTVLDRATTMESLLTLLPAARDLLQLPPAEPATDTAAKLNAALAARAAKPAAQPPPAKPAKPAAKARKPA